jgi:hypothetical protein
MRGPTEPADSTAEVISKIKQQSNAQLALWMVPKLNYSCSAGIIKKPIFLH